MGFEDRKRVKKNPQNPGKLTFDWRTFDNCWRYSVRGDDHLMGNLFPGLAGKYGNARNLKFIVLEPALYQITGRNKQGSHRISSNLCLSGVMDKLTVYRRAIRVDEWEILGKGYWSDLIDKVTGAQNGGQWASTIAIYLLEAEFAPYDPKKEELGKYKKVKIGQIAYLQMRGFSSKLGWDKSAAAYSVDPKNCAGMVATNVESFLQEAEKKSEKDKFYPSFTFLQFDEIPKIGEELREIGNKMYDELAEFLGNHFEYYSEDEAEPDVEEEEEGAKGVDFKKRMEEEEEEEEKKPKKRRKTKTEQAVEQRRAELKGEEAVEKIEEEEEEEAGIPDDLPF